MNREKLALLTIMMVIVLFAFNAKAAYSSSTGDLQQVSTVSNQSDTILSMGDNSTVFNMTHLQSPSDQAQQSFWTFLNQIAGINTKNYDVSYFRIHSGEVPGSQKLQTAISAIISNSQENLSIAMVLIEGKVRFYDLNRISGTLGGASLDITDCLISSKSTIAKYQTNFNASYCDGFDQIVPSTVKAENTTIDTEDTLLTVQYSENLTNQVKYAELSWYKKIGDSAIPAQSIQAKVAKNGILTFFADSLGLYQVATTNVAVTKENALNISMPIIYAYAEENGRTVESIGSTLTYVTDLSGSRGDSFLIYPEWVISAEFDGSNVMGVTGYDVLIWADSGAVCSEGTQGNYQDIAESTPWNQCLLTVVTIVFVAPLCMVAYAKRQHKVIGGKKAIVRLCGITIMSALLFSVLMAQPSFAYPSTIYGSTSSVPNDEVTLDASITNQIGNWSSDVGYTPYNWYGTNTTASNLYIGAYDHGETASIVFYIGHGDDGTESDGYAILDNSGSWVLASSIYDNSIAQSSGHHKVAVLWSCHQGEDIGEMPRAWLHTTSLSADGYNNPDYSGQAFIGWSGLAPFLGRDDWGTNAGYNFLYNFYYSALILGFNLNFALDYSADVLWQETFDECVFSTGTGDGNMVVYGQGTMYIGTEQWVSGIVDYDSGYVAHAVDNPTNLIGPQDDGQFVHLHAGEQGDFAWVTGYMNAEASGDIYLAGYSGTGYTSHLIVYVSNDYSNWDVVCNGYVTDDHPPYIHCGYSSGFSYIGISVQDNIGLSACMYIDAVHVVG